MVYDLFDSYIMRVISSCFDKNSLYYTFNKTNRKKTNPFIIVSDIKNTRPENISFRLYMKDIDLYDSQFFKAVLEFYSLQEFFSEAAFENSILCLPQNSSIDFDIKKSDIGNSLN